MGLKPKHNTFRGLLEGKAPTKKTLASYVTSLAEWWNTEFKVAATNGDLVIRTAVCALANVRGGEVFVGVADDRTVVGSSLTLQRLNQVLKQGRARPGSWYVVDMNQVVADIMSVPIGSRKSKKWAYVLRVQPAGMPVFLKEPDGRMSLYVRQGESSVRCDGLGALEWTRRATREEVLITCYLELRTLSKVVGTMYPGLAMGLGLNLPYLMRRLEDGTVYRYLTPDDLHFLLGEAVSNGYQGGIVQDLFEFRFKVEQMQGQGLDRAEQYHELNSLLRRARQDLSKCADSFRNYLRANRIPIPEDLGEPAG